MTTKSVVYFWGGFFSALVFAFLASGNCGSEKTYSTSVPTGETYNLLLNAEAGDVFVACYESVCKPYIITAHHGTWIEYAGHDRPLQNDGSYIGTDASIANLTTVRGVIKTNSRPEICNQFQGKLSTRG